MVQLKEERAMACSRAGRWVLGGLFWLAASSPVTAATVTVAWDPNPEPNVTNYNVYVRTQSGSFGAPLAIGNRTTWTFTGLQNNVQYYFAVQAQSASGTSPLSQIAYVTPIPNLPGSEASRSDFNRDGMFDVLWQHRTTGQLSAWHLNGTTVVGSRWLEPSSVNPVWKMSGSADLNRDGKADLIWHNATTGELTYWLMDGVLNYSAGFLPGPVDPSWQIASVRDFNNDGNPDFWWRHQVTGDLQVWYMNGTTLSQIVTPNPGRIADINWKLRGTADFTGDGRADALWHNEATGEIRVWRLGGADGITFQDIPTLSTQFVAPGWRIAAVGNADASGGADILWQSDTTGGLVLWTTSGSASAVNILSGAYLSIPAADVNWKIMVPK